MLNQTSAQEVLNALGSNTNCFCEIFCEHSVRNGLFLEDSKIDKISTGTDSGVGLRIVKGDSTAYAYVNSFEQNTILKTAKELSKVFSDSKFNRNIELANIVEFQSHIKTKPDSVDMQAKVDLLHELDRCSRSHSKLINQVSARYMDSQQDIIVANSNGLYAKDSRIRSRYVAQVIAGKGDIIQTGYEAPGEALGWEYIENADIQATALKAATRAVKMLDAKPAPSGKMTVVLSGKAGGTMVHEACGHSLEADFLYKKTSIFTGQIGKQIASPLISVIDDGSLKYQYGFMNIDDEGTPTRKNILIENGILKNLITDKLNADMLGLELSGNGRRQSYRNKPVPRMTNTYIAPGESNPEDIIASVDYGLFVVKMGGGQVNTTNGDFVFEVSEGYLIEKGKITVPIRGATLCGNGPEVLSSVDMVGSDISFMPGICGKGDHAPVSDGQPTLRIPQIVVGGQGS